MSTKPSFVEKHPYLSVLAGFSLFAAVRNRWDRPEFAAWRGRRGMLPRTVVTDTASYDMSDPAEAAAYEAERQAKIAEQQAYAKDQAAQAAGYTDWAAWEAAKQESEDYWAEHNRRALERQGLL